MKKTIIIFSILLIMLACKSVGIPLDKKYSGEYFEISYPGNWLSRNQDIPMGPMSLGVALFTNEDFSSAKATINVLTLSMPKGILDVTSKEAVLDLMIQQMTTTIVGSQMADSEPETKEIEFLGYPGKQVSYNGVNPQTTFDSRTQMNAIVIPLADGELLFLATAEIIKNTELENFEGLSQRIIDSLKLIGAAQNTDPESSL